MRNEKNKPQASWTVKPPGKEGWLSSPLSNVACLQRFRGEGSTGNDEDRAKKQSHESEKGFPTRNQMERIRRQSNPSTQ
jgi:hypothetical protein